MSPKLPRVTGPAVARALQRAGWIAKRQRGSHLRLEHPTQVGLMVTVPMHAGEDLPVGTLKAILDTTGLSADELRKLL